jgi:hypothetical protein
MEVFFVVLLVDLLLDTIKLPFLHCHSKFAVGMQFISFPMFNLKTALLQVCENLITLKIAMSNIVPCLQLYVILLLACKLIGQSSYLISQ